MRNWIIRLLVSAIALSMITMLDHGIKITTHGTAAAVTVLTVVVVLGLANSIIRPIIMFFAWPVNCLTFGLFGFALNVVLFWLAGTVVPGFKVIGLWNAMIGFLVMGLIGSVLNYFLVDGKQKGIISR